MTAPSTQVTTLLTQAGHPEAMPVLLEVFEAEARRQRRSGSAE